MRVGMGERNAILSAKSVRGLCRYPWGKSEGEDTAKAGDILPASKCKDRHETVAVAGDFPVSMAVDIDRMRC